MRVGVWADGRVDEPLLGALDDELKWRANLGLDLAGFETVAERDPELARVADRWGG